MHPNSPEIRSICPDCQAMVLAEHTTYETKLKGWKDIPDNIWDKGFSKLPREIKEYISFIEQRVNCNVTIVSVGPQRHETIIR